jgi:flavin reductase (DIM6/NTAB) family NADH-FMN oxidoreductase RutF
VIIDPKDLDAQSVYKLLIGSVVPRPIAWTSTVNEKGTRNLAPFSFFTVASRYTIPYSWTKYSECHPSVNIIRRAVNGRPRAGRRGSRP